MSTLPIAEQIARIKGWRADAIARHSDLALAVIEGSAAAQAELDKADADIAAADARLSTLRAAQAASDRREVVAAAAEREAALAAARQRVDLLVADRLLQLSELVEAIRTAERAYDAVRDVSALAAELAKLGLRAGDGSALVLGEIGRRLEYLLRQRFGRFDELTGIRRTGRRESDADFVSYLAEEQRLLRVQVLQPAMAGSVAGGGDAEG